MAFSLRCKYRTLTSIFKQDQVSNIMIFIIIIIISNSLLVMQLKNVQQLRVVSEGHRVHLQYPCNSFIQHVQSVVPAVIMRKLIRGKLIHSCLKKPIRLSIDICGFEAYPGSRFMYILFLVCRVPGKLIRRSDNSKCTYLEYISMGTNII